MQERFSLVEQNTEKNYKIWKIFNLDTLTTKYEVAEYDTGKTLYTGTEEGCRDFIKKREVIL